MNTASQHCKRSGRMTNLNMHDRVRSFATAAASPPIQQSEEIYWLLCQLASVSVSGSPTTMWLCSNETGQCVAWGVISLERHGAVHDAGRLQHVHGQRAYWRWVRDGVNWVRECYPGEIFENLYANTCILKHFGRRKGFLYLFHAAFNALLCVCFTYCPFLGQIPPPLQMAPLVWCLSVYGDTLCCRLLLVTPPPLSDKADCKCSDQWDVRLGASGNYVCLTAPSPSDLFMNSRSSVSLSVRLSAWHPLRVGNAAEYIRQNLSLIHI